MTESSLIYRHRFWVRVTHWINVICMTVMLMSGPQIFNAHPALYWASTALAFVFRLALRDQWDDLRAVPARSIPSRLMK
jgi:cytochrome b subunit of formate dehydrogenase